MLCAWRNGYTIIRVLQDDVMHDRVNIDQLCTLIGDASRTGGSQLRICETERTGTIYAGIEEFHSLFVSNPASFDNFTGAESDHEEELGSDHEEDVGLPQIHS